MRFVIVLIPLLLGCMKSDKFSTLDLDLAAEWVQLTVMSGEQKAPDTSAIEGVLNTALMDGPSVHEWEIDEAIKNGLASLQSDYENGDISKQDFEKLTAEYSDRDRIRRELVEAGAGGNLEDALGASEYLAALLGFPTEAFEAMTEAYGTTFTNHLRRQSKLYERNKLLRLVPKALKVTAKQKQPSSLKQLGLEDKRAQECFLHSVEELEANLNKSLRET